ncbi:MAG: hypothetical protein HY059_10120 [Proteobacteria bacterium]|nr:hypothetical protein [Pseudomonadota bacterium]
MQPQPIPPVRPELTPGRGVAAERHNVYLLREYAAELEQFRHNLQEYARMNPLSVTEELQRAFRQAATDMRTTSETIDALEERIGPQPPILQPLPAIPFDASDFDRVHLQQNVRNAALANATELRAFLHRAAAFLSTHAEHPMRGEVMSHFRQAGEDLGFHQGVAEGNVPLGL